MMYPAENHLSLLQIQLSWTITYVFQTTLPPLAILDSPSKRSRFQLKKIEQKSGSKIRKKYEGAAVSCYKEKPIQKTLTLRKLLVEICSSMVNADGELSCISTVLLIRATKPKF